MDHGYIKLHRKFFLNTLWKEPREYSRAEAWLDLIQSARFESSQEVFNGRVIDSARVRWWQVVDTLKNGGDGEALKSTTFSISCVKTG